MDRDAVDRYASHQVSRRSHIAAEMLPWPGAVPTSSQYAVAPVSAVHVNVAEDPF